jgi:hypothetical protein
MKRFILFGTSVVAASVMVAHGGVTPLQAQASSKTTAFTGARLIDGTDRRPVDNATIVVRDGRIVAAGGPPPGRGPG